MKYILKNKEIENSQKDIKSGYLGEEGDDFLVYTTNQTNNRIREEWKKEFRKQFIWDDENELGMPTNPFPSSDRVISFIAELLKSQREEERLRSAKIVEELMDDSEHWQPIASRIMDRVIICKEDLSLIKNN